MLYAPAFSFWFCREDQPGLGLGLRSHNSGGTVFSLKKFFPPTSNQFVGVSASRTFLSPFTKGTRVLALVIRFLHFCAHSMGIHYTKQTSTSPHLHSLPISANFTLISTKSGLSDTFSPPPPGCVCAWGASVGLFRGMSVCVVPIFAQPNQKSCTRAVVRPKNIPFFACNSNPEAPRSDSDPFWPVLRPGH